MELFFSILSHVIIIFSFISKFILFGWITFTEEKKDEKILRCMAFSTSLLIFYGARAAKVSLAEFMLKAASLTNPISIGLTSIIAPACAGIIMAGFVVSTIKKNADRAIRIMILFGIFATLQFGDLYLRALGLEGFSFDKVFLPNISFTISIGLYAILRY